MAYQFNVFTGQLDIVGGSTTSWKTPVSTFSALPSSGNISGDVRVASDTGIGYEWSGSAWTILNGVYPTTVSATSTPDGVSVDGSNNLTLHVADGTNPGLLSVTTQTIAGDKTFTGNETFSNNISTPGIYFPFGPAISTQSGFMTDSSGVHKFDWVNGNLTDTSNNTQLNWSTSGINFPQLTASTVPYLNSSNVLTSSSVTPTQLSYLDATSSIQTQLNSTEKTANKGVANGYAPLDASAKIPSANLPSMVFQYQGAWDPSTNTPTLTDLTGTSGFVYRVDTTATGPIIGLNDPSMVNFQIGNLIIYSGTVWQQVASADGVTSVNGAMGAVTVNAINQLTGDGTSGPASGSQSTVFTLTATSNSTLTTLSALSLPTSQLSGQTTLAQLPSLSANTLLGNNTGSTGNTLDLSVAQVNAILPIFTNTLNGLAPLSGGGTTNYLRADGTWSPPSGATSGTVTSVALTAPSFLSVSGSPITSSGTLAISYSGTPLPSTNGGTGVSNSGTFTYGSNNLTFTTSGVTSLTLPTSGTVLVSNTGDIGPSSFSASNNVSSAADVTGLVFSSAGSFEAFVTVFINATIPLRQTFNIQGALNGASAWNINQTSAGDESGFYFTITSGGQLQYTNNNYPGFVSATVKFRANALTP